MDFMHWKHRSTHLIVWGRLLLSYPAIYLISFCPEDRFRRPCFYSYPTDAKYMRVCMVHVYVHPNAPQSISVAPSSRFHVCINSAIMHEAQFLLSNWYRFFGHPLPSFFPFPFFTYRHITLVMLDRFFFLFGRCYQCVLLCCVHPFRTFFFSAYAMRTHFIFGVCVFAVVVVVFFCVCFFLHVCYTMPFESRISTWVPRAARNIHQACFGDKTE